MKSIKFSLMLCAAVLAAGCVTKQTYNTEVQKVDAYAALSKQLSGELGSDQAQITQLQNQLKVTMVNEILFPEGGWTLSPKGKQALAKIAPTLSNLPGQQIVVEGFTDNVPIGPELKRRFPSNLELSSARADDVVRFLTSKGCRRTRSRRGGSARRVRWRAMTRCRAGRRTAASRLSFRRPADRSH